MDENTKIILQMLVAALLTFLGGQGLWDFIKTRYQRRFPTRLEAVDGDIKTASMALEIAKSLRLDIERLQEEIKQNQAAYQQQLDEIEARYQKQIELIEAQYEKKIREYEDKLSRQRVKIELLEQKVRVLEEEREELSALKKVLESGH